ncbi:hypothetical protein Ocin01_18217 [Orchesella cincta]|uniref:Chitin-binding type-2 domain-containing protein n=1 Tax=Orchesella cincta TaxID=48709 RepID=A0A1D2M660_ORCCI|nr:hypothetical protein Ocin01_18217 [Orchesella cincta]
MKPGEERRFQSQGLFIVVFFKNEKCTEEDTGALDWFERLSVSRRNVHRGNIYLPHPDCSLYIICINGEAFEEQCRVPLYFNPERKTVNFQTQFQNVWRNEASCFHYHFRKTNRNNYSQPPVTDVPPPGALTQCGQTIKADSGYIQYKLNQNYNSGELCAFLIQLDQRELCDFTLEAHGIIDMSSLLQF